MELMAHATPSSNCWVLGASSVVKRGLWAAAGASRSVNRWLHYNDRRGETRLKAHFLAQLSGESGSFGARGVNISSGGALLLAAQPLALDSVVFFHAKSLGLMGFAHVRHCSERRRVNGYAIGVEFPSPLMREEMGTWQFHRVRQTDSGWSVDLEAKMNLSRALRTA
jgi:hypothetical protein